MLVLRQAQHERVGAEPRAEVAEAECRDLPPASPHAELAHADPACDGGVGDAELAVELERPRVDGHRARRLARPRAPVDDPERHAEAHEPECQGEPGGTGADDEDLRLRRHQGGASAPSAA